MDAAGSVIKAQYDALGRKQWADDPNQGHKSFSYDGFGRLVSQTDANGDTITLIYDVLDRVIERRVNGVTDARWTFDNALASAHTYTLTQKSRGAFVESYEYDAYQRPVKVTTLYVGKLFEHITTTAMGQSTRIEQKAYIGDAAVLTEIRTGGGLPTYKVGFLHKDRLGSVIAITDEDGKETEWHAFDAFGLPLKGDFTSSGGLLNTASTVEAYSATDNRGTTTRGFTGHDKSAWSKI